MVDERGRYLNLPAGRLLPRSLLVESDFVKGVRELAEPDAPEEERPTR
jgi:hypothetical protein